MLRTFLAGAIAMTVSVGQAFADDRELHASWDGLLKTYIVESEDGVNRFNYGALKANAEDQAVLDAYLEGFEDFDVESLSDNEQFALWSNVYNALTIKHIVGRYPVKSIRSGYIVGPWKRVKTTVDGESVSLDHIEHGILRVEFDDPRVHYAVNCASYGCPNLRPDAWFGETLDEDLDDAARAFVNHPRGVTIRARSGLQVSQIYKWFREDFGGSEEGGIEHLLEYAEPELAEQIRANADIKKHEYDWALNDAPDASS